MVCFKKHANTEGTEPKNAGWPYRGYSRNIGFWWLTGPIFEQSLNLG